MNKQTIFNYIFNSSILIAGIILLATGVNLLLGLLWIFIGILMLILTRTIEIHFKKEKERIDEFFRKLKEDLK